MAGLTRGSVLLSFLQWFGRSNVLFLILHSIPEVSPCLSPPALPHLLYEALPSKRDLEKLNSAAFHVA